MNARLGRMPWALGWLFLSTIAYLALAAWVPLASRQCSASPPGEEIRAWIAQLGGEDFAAREKAAFRLASAGETAITPLIDCIRGNNPEAAWRAAGALVQLALSSNDQHYAQLIAALNCQTGGSCHKFASLANEIKTQRAVHRRHVALEKIRAYGGRFSSDLALAPVDIVANPTDILLLAPPPDLPPVDIVPPVTQVVDQAHVLIADAYVSPLLAKEVATKDCGESLTIDQNWRGGDAGLTPLCDLPELCVLSLSRAPLTDAALDTIAQLPAIQSLEIEDMSFSSAALKKFRQRQPRTRVVSRNAKAFEVSAER